MDLRMEALVPADMRNRLLGSHRATTALPVDLMQVREQNRRRREPIGLSITRQ
jgi:hypothetical protein